MCRVKHYLVKTFAGVLGRPYLPRKTVTEVGSSGDLGLFDLLWALAELLASTEWQEVLRAFYRLLQAAKKLLQVGVALDEIDFRGIDD
jgi:hypothetical protein